MRKITFVMCAVASALMLAGSAAAGHKPVPAPGTTVTPDSLSGGRAALVIAPLSFSSGR
jgi:hypothetical protein